MHANLHVARKRAWLEAELALVAKLWSDGHSASQIANRLQGRTRNAVIGCVTRLQLSARKTRHGAIAARTYVARERKQKPAQNVRSKRTRAEIREARRLAKSKVWLPLAETRPVSLVERGYHQCAWPVGEAVFCGEPKIELRPYCAAHCRMAYLPRGAS